MREVIIDNAADLERIIEACKAGGHSQIACVSNAGLTAGKMRVTILPNSAFEPTMKDK